MIECLIIDDEPLALEVLEKFINETPGLKLAGKCRNAFEATEQLLKSKPDLMFLDIEMPLVGGIQFLKSLPNPPKTILATAYKEFAYEGFELEVVDYLLKPISYARFLKAIKKFKEQLPAATDLDQEEKYLLIKDRKGILRISKSEILFVEGSKDYVKVVTTGQTYLMLQTMKETESLLGNKFIRVHRSYIVATDQVKLIQSDSLVLRNHVSIPIGNAFKQELLGKLKY